MQDEGEDLLEVALCFCEGREDDFEKGEGSFLESFVEFVEADFFFL